MYFGKSMHSVHTRQTPASLIPVFSIATLESRFADAQADGHRGELTTLLRTILQYATLGAAIIRLQASQPLRGQYHDARGYRIIFALP